MALDALELVPDRLGQRVAVGVAHERREALDLIGAGRQAVGLLVGDHLQAMLDPAQEPVGADQLIRDRGLQPAVRDQGAERVAGRGRAHLRHPAAQDQLLGLDEELDLADAAAADLDVVARHPDRAVAAVGVDLALDRVDVADRGVVEVAAPQERLEGREEAVAGRAVARDHARLDQRRPLPVLAVPLVVLLGVLDRQRQRMAGRMRAQPEIGAEDVAVRGAVLEQVDQRAGQAHRAGHRRLAAAVAEALGVEQDDEVDVARIVELAAAELAHAEHDQARFGGRPVGSAAVDLAARRRVAQGQLERPLDREIGEPAERRGHALERPEAGEVGQRHQERDPPLALAQARHQPRAPVAGGGADLGEQPLEGGIRSAGQERAQDLGLGQQRLAEVGAVAEHGREQAVGLDRALGRIDAPQGLGQAPPAGETALDRREVAATRQFVRHASRLGHHNLFLARSRHIVPGRVTLSKFAITPGRRRWFTRSPDWCFGPWPWPWRP